METNKVSIIGAGQVGSAIAFALMEENLASEIVLVDIDEKRAAGEAMDIAHGASLVSGSKVTFGKMEATQWSDILIVTAGAAQKENESRIDLLERNAEIFKNLIPQLCGLSPNSLLLIVTNPVDIMTTIAQRLSKFPVNRVFGSGTVLDTGRLKHLLSNRFKINAKNIHGFVIGEHGDAQMIPWSCVHAGTLSVHDFCEKNNWNEEEFKKEIEEEVKNAAYDVISKKGYTNYAVALAVRRIIEAIIRDERSLLSVSAFNGSLYSSYPVILGSNGVEGLMELKLDDEEMACKSACEMKIREELDKIKEKLSSFEEML